MELLTAEEIKTIGQWSIAFQIFAIILTVLLIGAAIAAYRWKKKSVVYMRLTFLAAAILPALAFARESFYQFDDTQLSSADSISICTVDSCFSDDCSGRKAFGYAV